MKKKIYDYSGFRLWNIRQPEYKHLLLLLGWVIYLAMYVITENLIPESQCHVVHCVVDDWIPFVEYFVIPYCIWYILIVGTIGYFMFFDVKSFIGVQKFIIVTQMVGMIIYVIWPSVQYLRPLEFERNNFCTWLLGLIYSVDTPTGVCPSLHVAYSVGIASAWLKKKDTKVWFKVLIVLIVISICMAVNFVKQHSFVDVVAAVPVCILAEIIAFGETYWLPKWKNKRGNK